MADESDLLEGLENLDITACKERITQLQAQRERRRELTERLQEKLKALNNELAARKEESDRCKKELLEEQARNRRLAEQRRDREGSSKEMSAIQDGAKQELELQNHVSNVRRFMEQHLQDKVERGVTKNDLGIRVFDEVELMVEKSAEEQAKEATYIDTVLVTYSVPNTELKYNLSFRVDKNMTSKKLREDACLYWGLSEVEFILKTLSNAKVHDELTIQNCFRAHEEAHFILAQKTPKNITLMDKELSSIRPLIGKKARMRASKSSDAAKGDGAVGGGSGGGELAEQMRSLPGLFQFMTQRDQDVKQHLSRTKLRSICVYITFTVMTLTSVFVMRPPGYGYTCRKGIVDLMTADTYSVKFDQIRTQPEVWDWLENTVSAQLFDDSSNLRKHNYVIGYLQLRMQQVSPASSTACPLHTDVNMPLPDNVTCFETVYNEDTADSSQLDGIKSYWLDRTGLDGRALTREPWVYTDADESAPGAASASATYYSFDSSGYSAEYNLRHVPLDEVRRAFQADMAFLRRMGWLDLRTRATHVNFVLYNGNYDLWLSNRYTFEMNTLGSILPTADVSIFKPVVYEWGPIDLDLLVIDAIRMLIVVYVCLYQISSDYFYERRVREAGWKHFLSFQCLADVGITVLYVYTFVHRYVVFTGSTTDYQVDHLNEFRDSGATADVYKAQMVCDATLLALALYRTVFFLRVNRQIFLIWCTVERAVAAAISLLIVAIPVMLGFVVLAMAVGGAYYENDRTFGHALTRALILLYGDDKTVQTYDPNKWWEISFKIVLTFTTKLVFINSWIAILIQVYQKTRVAAGYVPSSYRWKEYNYVTWFLPWPFRNIYLNFLRPNIEQPPKASADDD